MHDLFLYSIRIGIHLAEKNICFSSKSDRIISTEVFELSLMSEMATHVYKSEKAIGAIKKVAFGIFRLFVTVFWNWFLTSQLHYQNEIY